MFSISWFSPQKKKTDAKQAYKTSVQHLLPSWASAMGDPQEATAERHLGELQFNIEATGNPFRVVTVVGVLWPLVPNKTPETMKMFGSTTPWKIQNLCAINLCFGVVYIYEKVALLTWWWQW